MNRRRGDDEPAGPVPIGQVLDGLLKQWRLDERRREGPLASAWDVAVSRVAGSEVVSRMRPVAFRGGTLTVEVEGAALLHQARGFWAGGIRAALAEDETGRRVRDIRFVPAPGGGVTGREGNGGR